ncbi:hypothetical protein ACFLTP_05910 [Chloroflexota bacterium]
MIPEEIAKAITEVAITKELSLLTGNAEELGKNMAYFIREF